MTTNIDAVYSVLVEAQHVLAYTTEREDEFIVDVPKGARPVRVPPRAATVGCQEILRNLF